MRNEIQNPFFEKYFTNYENFIIAKGFKGKSYVAPIKEFLIWMERFGITSIKSLTSKEIVCYFEYLIERPNKRRSGTLAGNTIKTHLQALSLFIENLLMCEEIKKGVIIPTFSNDDQKPRNILTIDEVKLLYGQTENLLEKALLSVGYGCGLRRSEMQNLNLADVQLSLGMVIVRSGKGSKRREVPMSDKVLEDLKKYVLEYRWQFLGKHSEPAFFINKRGERMSGESLNKALKKIIVTSKNQIILDKKITLHCLRHSVAHHLTENNAGIDFIKSFLGHSYINTAYIYAIKNKKSHKLITLN